MTIKLVISTKIQILEYFIFGGRCAILVRWFCRRGEFLVGFRKVSSLVILLARNKTREPAKASFKDNMERKNSQISY